MPVGRACGSDRDQNGLEQQRSNGDRPAVRRVQPRELAVVAEAAARAIDRVEPALDSRARSGERRAIASGCDRCRRAERGKRRDHVPPETATGGACDCTGACAARQRPLRPSRPRRAAEAWRPRARSSTTCARLTRAFVAPLRPRKACAARSPKTTLSAPAAARPSAVARRRRRRPASRRADLEVRESACCGRSLSKLTSRR